MVFQLLTISNCDFEIHVSCKPHKEKENCFSKEFILRYLLSGPVFSPCGFSFFPTALQLLYSLSALNCGTITYISSIFKSRADLGPYLNNLSRMAFSTSASAFRACNNSTLQVKQRIGLMWTQSKAQGANTSRKYSICQHIQWLCLQICIAHKSALCSLLINQFKFVLLYSDLGLGGILTF